MSINMEKYKGKFIGPEEITKIEKVQDIESPMGNTLVHVTFKSKDEKTFSESLLDVIVTDEASDWTSVQTKRFSPVLRAATELAFEYDLDYGDIQPFVTRLGENLLRQYDRVENYFWKQDDKDFVPGYDVRNGVSLTDVYKKQKEIPKK